MMSRFSLHGRKPPGASAGWTGASRLRQVGAVSVVSVLALAVPAQAGDATHGPGSPTNPAKVAGGGDGGRRGTTAAALGVSASRLEDGLKAAKQAGGPANLSSAVAAFAASAGTSRSSARTILAQAFAGGGGTTGAAGVSPTGSEAGDSGARGIFDDGGLEVFARALGISASAAMPASHALLELAAGSHGLEPTSPAFGRIASDLGVSAERLNDAIRAVKLSTAGDAGPLKTGAETGAKAGVETSGATPAPASS